MGAKPLAMCLYQLDDAICSFGTAGSGNTCSCSEAAVIALPQASSRSVSLISTALALAIKDNPTVSAVTTFVIWRLGHAEPPSHLRILFPAAECAKAGFATNYIRGHRRLPASRTGTNSAPTYGQSINLSGHESDNANSLNANSRCTTWGRHPMVRERLPVRIVPHLVPSFIVADSGRQDPRKAPHCPAQPFFV